MKPRRLIDSDAMPTGERIELLFEGGHYVIRVDGASLMSSAMSASERAMADVARERLGTESAAVLIGGLGLGFTLRATLEAFGSDATVTVAEISSAVVRFNRGELGELTNHPLRDPRVTIHQGDVADALEPGSWDAILLDIDNGPEEFATGDNRNLYDEPGLRKLTTALSKGGVLIIWSAFESEPFCRRVRRLGYRLETLSVRGRANGKGPRHTLFVIRR